MMIEILDSTLREGEQTPGVSFSIVQKLEIARLLDQFGVDIIEAGHPVVSEDIYRTVKAIARENLEAEVLAHCRALTSDIDKALDCGVDWVGIFYCITDKSLEQRFRTDIEGAVNVVASVVEYAKAHGLKVRYTPEDTVRSDFENVIRVSKAAIDAGADRICIADTAGIMTPSGMRDFVTKMRMRLNVKLNVHCHNDLGMAAANSLTAIEAGAALVDVTINGLGERTGIAPLAEVCTALKLVHKSEAKWKMDLLPEMSRIVEEYSGIKVSSQAPIVGRNAFRHNAGLHVAAVLLDPNYYESIPAEMVGRQRDVVLGKMSSKQTIMFKLDQLNLRLENGRVNELLQHIKSNGCKEIGDEEFKELVLQYGGGHGNAN
jgi:2-isopropylmalate synthase